MGLINTLAITDSALTAQRLQMDVIANNTANADTTVTSQGGPYKREEVVMVPGNMQTSNGTGLAASVASPP